MPPCVQYDDLWPGGPRFARSGAGFALGTDSVLLADFAADRRVRRFADLGCGAGVLTVLLLHALPQAAAVGVELQPDAAQLCRNNLEANGLTGRAQILCADLREHRAVLARCSRPAALTSSWQTRRTSPRAAAIPRPTPCARTRATSAPAPCRTSAPP